MYLLLDQIVTERDQTLLNFFSVLQSGSLPECQDSGQIVADVGDEPDKSQTFQIFEDCSHQGIQKGTFDWKKTKLGLIWRQIQNLFRSTCRNIFAKPWRHSAYRGLLYANWRHSCRRSLFSKSSHVYSHAKFLTFLGAVLYNRVYPSICPGSHWTFSAFSAHSQNSKQIHSSGARKI